MAKISRVLLSVTDKTGILEFASALAAMGAELISTGGTARLLRDAGIPVADVSDVTGFPEMLDGRVKTMHPKIAGGILAMRGNPEHMAAIQAHGIAPIDMVVVNLYRFEEVAAKAGAPLAELIENIDIGGPTMLRAAAKNYQDVAVVTAPEDYPAILEETARHGRRTLARYQVAARQESLPHHRRLRFRHQRAPGTGGRGRPPAAAISPSARPN
jgi:phosphoribosylaminoimidazolecarboxamide formyltransferase/IMP cyclohydrolase